LNLSVDELKKDALWKVSQGTCTGSDIIKFLIEKHPCRGSEASLVVLSLLLEGKLKAQTVEGVTKFSTEKVGV
jgi:hypothetical protein